MPYAYRKLTTLFHFRLPYKEQVQMTNIPLYTVKKTMTYLLQMILVLICLLYQITK